MNSQHVLEVYMEIFKEDIKHEFHLKNPESVMEAMQFS